MQKVIAVPVVIGALGAVSVNFREYMHEANRRECEVGNDSENSIAGTAKILRKVMPL